MERESVLSDVDAVQGPRALHSIGVTVCGLKPDTEGDVIGREQWKAIHERRAAGASVSAIAREFSNELATRDTRA